MAKTSEESLSNMLSFRGGRERLKNLVRDVDILEDAVTAFTDKMAAKLIRKSLEGYRGWNDRSDPAVKARLYEMLDTHVSRAVAGDSSQFVDIANICMMLEFHEKGLARGVPVQHENAPIPPQGAHGAAGEPEHVCRYCGGAFEPARVIIRACCDVARQVVDGYRLGNGVTGREALMSAVAENLTGGR